MGNLEGEISICNSSGMKKVEAYMKKNKEKQQKKVLKEDPPTSIHHVPKSRLEIEGP